MHLIKLLESIATTAHYRLNMNELIEFHSNEVKDAYCSQKADLLKKQISNIESFANETHVVQI